MDRPRRHGNEPQRRFRRRPGLLKCTRQPDADAVLRQRRKQKKKAAEAAAKKPATPEEECQRQQKQKQLAKRLDQVTADVEKAEGRIHDINEMFCDPTFFDRTSRDQVKKLEAEQKTLSGKIEELMAEWESLEAQIAELKG